MSNNTFLWLQTDSKPITCKEKIKILEDNYAELNQILKDTFDDAVIMGVDENFMCDLFKNMIDKLRSSKL